MRSNLRFLGWCLLLVSVGYTLLLLNQQFLEKLLGPPLLWALSFASVTAMAVFLLWMVIRLSGKDDFTLEQARGICPSTMPPWLPIVIVGIVLIICLPGIRSSWFIRDDAMKLLNVRFGGSLWKGFTELFTTINYRPLEYLPWHLDYSLWGTHAAGYFATNALMHSINSLLVFFLFRRLLAHRAQQIFATIVYAAHPVNARLCVYISQRATLLAAFYVFSVILLYDRYLRTGLKRYFAFCLSVYIVGMFSRESVCALPLLLILWTAFFCGRDILRTKGILLRTLARLTLFFVLTALYFAWRTYLLGDMGRFIDNPQMSYLFSLKVFLFDFPREFFVPIASQVSRSPHVVAALYSVLSLLTVSAILLRSNRLQAGDYRALLFSFFWMMIAASPTLNLMGWLPGTIPPSYVHLPSFGLILVFGILWSPRRGLRGAVARVVCVILCSFFVFSSFLAAKGIRNYRYPPIRKALQCNLVEFVNRNYPDCPPGTVFLIRDIPPQLRRHLYDHFIKCIGDRRFLDYLFLPVVTREDAMQWQSQTEVVLPELLRHQVWVNWDEIHPYSGNRTMRSRGDVEGHLPICGDEDNDDDGDGIVDNIYIFRDCGHGCSIMGDDFYRIYRFIRSPHWDLPYRRIWVNHPTFADIRGKDWNAVYMSYRGEGAFEEVSREQFFSHPR